MDIIFINPPDHIYNCPHVRTVKKMVYKVVRHVSDWASELPRFFNLTLRFTKKFYLWRTPGWFFHAVAISRDVVYELWGEPKDKKDIGALFPGAGGDDIEDIRQGKIGNSFEFNSFIRVDSIEEQNQVVRSES